MRDCLVDFNVNDRVSSVCALIGRLAPLWELAAGAECRVDLSRCQYLGPDGASVLVAAVQDARQRGVCVEVSMPEGPPALVAFCEHSGLGHWLAGSAVALDDPDWMTVPVRILGQSRHNDPQPVLEMLARHTEVSEDLAVSLQVSVNETIQNVEDHAGSQVGAVFCARYQARSREVRVAIVDSGAGIGTTLKRGWPDTRDAQHALARVLGGGYSSRSRKANFGQGIANLSGSVRLLGGELFILT